MPLLRTPQQVPDTVIVNVDSRERKPLLFPATIGWRADRTGRTHEIAVQTRVRPMYAGDYSLEFPVGVWHDRYCTIERKGSVREIYNNLFTKDWVRVARAFTRLAESAHPTEPSQRYLLVEPSLYDFERFEIKEKLDPGAIMDRLIQVSILFDLPLLLVPGASTGRCRRRLGEFMIRLILGRLAHDPNTYEPRDAAEYDEWTHKFAKKWTEPNATTRRRAHTR